MSRFIKGWVVNKLRFCVAMAVSAGALALAAAADAGVVFYSYGSGAQPLALITDFSKDSEGSAPTTAPAGYSWAAQGTGVILNTTSGNGAEPAIGPAGAYGVGNYLSIEGGNSETLNIPAAAGLKNIGLYVGSLDSYNTVVFTLVGGQQVTYWGDSSAQPTFSLDNYSGSANGAQNAANTNGVFDFSFDKAVQSITFESGFEIASISGGVPEPATWAMLILGVAMIGCAARRRSALAVVAI
jgi:hypothetical protein